MSYIDLTGNKTFTSDQISQRLQSAIRQRVSNEDEMKAARIGRKATKTVADKAFIAKVDEHIANCIADVKLVQADNALLRSILAYKAAVARLAQYVLADGRVELTEMQATGEQVFNEDTMEMDDVMHEVVVQSYIEAVEPTVEVTTYSDDIDAEPTVSTVTNPLIVTDVAEREAAQAVIDITPSEIKDD